MYKRDVNGALISTGQLTTMRDGTVHYDTNISCKTTYDSGVTDQGSHGRFATFQDSRQRPFVTNPDVYQLALARGNITSSAIPLFVARPSALIVENGTSQWEVTVQPGLALTWTGPCYGTNKGSIGPQTDVDWLYASYPNFGWLPFYTATTAPGATPTSTASTYGAINLSSVGVSGDCLATTVASRLTTLISAACGFTVTVTAPTASASASMTQQYSFANASTSQSIYFDFSLPIGASSRRYNPVPSKAGVLQACKLLGFVPGQVFQAPPAATTLAPRAYQLGFRSTINLFCYKTARWIPEDTNSRMPKNKDEADSPNAQTLTYFDCYSYQHFTNNIINPTFQRCIYDDFDSALDFADRNLTTQLFACTYANTKAVLPWSASTTYTGFASGSTVTAVVYQGLAWICTSASSKGDPPSDASLNWQSCGAAMNYTYIDGKVGYLTGDVVTISNGTNVYYATATGTTTGPPPTSASSANGWTSVLAYANNGGDSQVQILLPKIATLAPTVSFNSATNLFTLNLDSYGFGGTTYANVDDGYGGYFEDTLFTYNVQQQNYNATLNDIARDSWGLTGTNTLTTPPYVVARGPNACFDEKMNVEVDDYFHQLFGNWPSTVLNYYDPRTKLTTSYVRYIPQASQAGLNVPSPLPLTSTSPGTVGLSASYLPYGRVGGTVPYIYTFAQDYTSIGLMWQPFDAVVVQSGSIPVIADYTTPQYLLNDSGQPVTLQTSGNTLKIIAELNVKPLSNLQSGLEYRTEIIFDPQTPVIMDLQSGRVFDIFDYQVFLRYKVNNFLRPLSLSDGGSVYFRWSFLRK
jgi:hypothetical protein